MNSDNEATRRSPGAGGRHRAAGITSLLLTFSLWSLLPISLYAQQDDLYHNSLGALASLEATIDPAQGAATSMEVWNISSEDGNERAVSVCEAKAYAANAFFCDKLPASTYLVTFTVQGGSSSPLLYYPGSFYIGEARLLELHDNEERHIRITPAPLTTGAMHLFLPRQVGNAVVALSMVRRDHPGVEIALPLASQDAHSNNNELIYDNLPLGEYVAHVRWEVGGHSDQLLISCVISSGSPCIRHIKANDSGSVSGKVETATGSAQPAYFLARTVGGSSDETRVNVDEHGFFAPTSLTPGTYRFELSRTDGRWLEVTPDSVLDDERNSVQVSADTVTSLKLIAHGGINSICGLVPLQGEVDGLSHLLLLGAYTGIRRDLLTERDGSFSLEHLPDDTYSLYSWHSDDVPYSNVIVMNSLQRCVVNVALGRDHRHEAAIVPPCSISSEW